MYFVVYDETVSGEQAKLKLRLRFSFENSFVLRRRLLAAFFHLLLSFHFIPFVCTHAERGKIIIYYKLILKKLEKKFKL